MILKSAKVYAEGLIHKGIILISNGIIKKIIFNPKETQIKNLVEKNQDDKVIDCKDKLVLPGIIDIHSHLRDLDQCEKETFLSGTKAAAFSGITTVFNMPNTKPPAITADQVKKWMKKAKNNIYIDVGFIAGVPKRIDKYEIKNIIDLGVLGFKLYPSTPLSEIDWCLSENLQKILNISSEYQVPIFIHAAYPISDINKNNIYKEFTNKNYSKLELQDKLYSTESEVRYVKFVIENYKKVINNNKLNIERYPIVHFCHISCIESYLAIQKTLNSYENFKISFEVTPHHLLLSNKMKIRNENFGKVLPPLRDNKHSHFLFNELKKGNIKLIATDHAPHSLKEKSQKFLKAPSGFPGFETYPLLLIDKVMNSQLPLDIFVKASAENPTNMFNLENKGFIREGYNADLYIVEKVSQSKINTKKFKTKAKYSPFENYITSVKIWKVFLRGIEVNVEKFPPQGNIIKKKLQIF